MRAAPRVFDLLETTVDTFGNRANAVQANMTFTDFGEPDHNPPYIVISTSGGGGGDTTAPAVSITSPSNGATVSGTTLVTADASDAGGVTKVEFYLDGALVWTDTSSPYEWSWSTTTTSDGSHSLSAKAHDAAGNVGTSATIGVTVDNSGGGGSGITLSATGYKVRGLQKADLSWSGASSTQVDIYRNGAVITTTANDGFHTDNINNSGGGSYTYKLCEAGTATCSNEATVTF